MRNSYIQSRKFKYGSVATVFTIAFVAIVFIFNVIFTALAEKYMWYIDMTESQVFSLSEEAKEHMSDVNQEVNIYFASEPDVLMNGENAGYTRMIYTTALQLEENFPNVHVECVDVLKNPSFFREFAMTAATDIDTDSVVIQSSSEVRVQAATSFFTFNDSSDLSTVWAYNGEKAFLSAIMQITQSETPIVSFTSEHGEELENSLYLMNLFAENGFQVNTVNLAQDTLDDDCRILIIYNPIYDFIGAEAEDQNRNEIEKIDKFLDNFGCLMVFADPENVGNLTNLNEFLEEWGIAYQADTTVRDTEHAMSTDSYSIIPEYQKDTFGGSIYYELNELVTPPRTLIRKSAPIDILWEEGGRINSERMVSPVLKSYDTSEIVRDGMVIGGGSYNLMTISRERTILNDDYYYSYVIAVGSPSFAYQNYIQTNSYANEDILAATMKAVGRERVLANLTFKPFDDTELVITTAEANRLTIAMTLVIPAIAAVCGIVVITRRKHS